MRAPAALEGVERLTGAGLPILCSDPRRYLEAAYHTSSEVNARLHRHRHSHERALLLLSRIAPLHVVSMHDFSGSHHRFLVLDSGEFSWLIPDAARPYC